MIGMKFKIIGNSHVVQAISEPFVKCFPTYCDTAFLCVDLSNHKVSEVNVDEIKNFISDSEWERIRKE